MRDMLFRSVFVVHARHQVGISNFCFFNMVLYLLMEIVVIKGIFLGYKMLHEY